MPTTVETAAVCVLVLLFTFVSAVETFAAVAKEPEVNDASVRLRVLYVHTSEAVRVEPREVRVRVVFPHTSATSVPNVVRERDPDDHTAVGIVEARLVEAVRTVVFVLVLIVLTAVAIEAFNDDDALPTMVLVFELIAV